MDPRLFQHESWCIVFLHLHVNMISGPILPKIDLHTHAVRKSLYVCMYVYIFVYVSVCVLQIVLDPIGF